MSDPDSGKPEETTGISNEQLVNLGGTALLGTSVLVGLSMAIGRNQIAQRADKDGKRSAKLQAEGNKFNPIVQYGHEKWLIFHNFYY